jgi:TPR repeat protein
MMTRTVLTVTATLVSLVRVSSSEPPACDYEDGPRKCKTRCDEGSQTSCASLGLMYLRGQFVKSEWKAIAAKLDVDRLTADLISRACKLGDVKSCAPAKPSP